MTRRRGSFTFNSNRVSIDWDRLERDAIAFINAFKLDRGYAPTVREIAGGVGIKSTSTCHELLNRLESKGRIQRDYLITRSIRVLR